MVFKFQGGPSDYSVRHPLLHNELPKRPASYRHSKPRNPKSLETKTKKLPPPPTPKFLDKSSKIVNYSNITSFQVFLVFLSFCLRSSGSGHGGRFFSFFRGVSGLGVLNPAAGRAFLNKEKTINSQFTDNSPCQLAAYEQTIDRPLTDH